MDGGELARRIGEISEAVLQGDDERTARLISDAIQAGAEASAILQDGLISAMDIVGQEYEDGRRYVPEMLISAEAMKAGMVILGPLLQQEGVEPRGVVVIGTVEGDLHDIGKNLVAIMLEGAGFKVIDLGVEIHADVFCQEVRNHKPDILALSALLTTTMVRIPEVLDALEQENLREGLLVLVGGAPITQTYADQVGADGYAADAAGAAKLAVTLLSEHPSQ